LFRNGIVKVLIGIAKYHKVSQSIVRYCPSWTKKKFFKFFS